MINPKPKSFQNRTDSNALRLVFDTAAVRNFSPAANVDTDGATGHCTSNSRSGRGSRHRFEPGGKESLSDLAIGGDLKGTKALWTTVSF